MQTLVSQPIFGTSQLKPLANRAEHKPGLYVPWRQLLAGLGKGPVGPPNNEGRHQESRGPKGGRWDGAGSKWH